MAVEVKGAQIANFLGLKVASENPARKFGGVKIEIESLRISEDGVSTSFR